MSSWPGSRCSRSARCSAASSWSENSLIAFRAIQGLGGALLAPAALSILITTFSEGRERNLALGVWGAASGSGGAAGVLLGGVLTSYLSWSWVFFINVPVGVAVIAVSPWLLRESRVDARPPPLRRRRCDVRHREPDAARLRRSPARPTSGWGDSLDARRCSAASALLIGAFIAIELRSPAPLLPLRIFRHRTLAAANVIAVLVGSVVFSQFFLLTLYMQQVLHYSAIQTGVALRDHHARDHRVLERRPDARDPARRAPRAHDGTRARPRSRSRC